MKISFLDNAECVFDKDKERHAEVVLEASAPKEFRIPFWAVPQAVSEHSDTTLVVESVFLSYYGNSSHAEDWQRIQRLYDLVTAYATQD